MSNKALITPLLTWLLVVVTATCRPAYATDNELAEQLLSQFNTLSIASGSFTQRKYFKILKHPIVSQGEIHLAKDLGLIWQTNSPVFSRLLLKNNGLYSDDGQQPIKKITAGDTLAKVLMHAMTGNIQVLKTQFIIDSSELADCVTLTPKEQQLATVIDKIALCGQRSTQEGQAVSRLLEQIILFEHAGNRTEIDLKLSAQHSLSEALRAQLH